MANLSTVRIIEEGPRNVVVEVAGVLDTANLALPAFLTLAQMTNNDVSAGKLWGFRFDRVQFSCAPGAQAAVFWAATTPQLVGAFSDANEMWWRHGGGLIPTNRLASGFTGSLDLNTYNWNATTQVFTLTMDLVKLYDR